MTIHSTHPFASEPDPVRRFRGRLGGAVTLWTAGEGGGRSGLTVSSLMVANGETASVLALVDPDSDFLDVVRETERCVVQGLAWPDRALAEMFAGTAPAPGGAFAHADFEQTEWGPRLVSADQLGLRRSGRGARGRLVGAPHLPGGGGGRHGRDGAGAGPSARSVLPVRVGE